MDFLKREGLYNPQLKDLRTDDPVATDLIGALLMVNYFTHFINECIWIA